MMLSVVIPAFNEAKIIGETIARLQEALRANERPGFEWEIIVCDNHSTDETAVIAQQAGAAVVFEPENQIAKARNTGASIAQGDWLLFMDADTYPKPELIAEMLPVMATGTCVGGSSTIRVEGGPLWYRLNMEGHNIDMRLFKVGWGLFLLCQRDAFTAVGGFDTDLYAFEDLAFVKKLKEYGKKTGKRFVVWHRFPVITSGRKGDLYDRWTMTRSLITAFWMLLTKRRQKGNGRNRLPFWYDGRR